MANETHLHDVSTSLFFLWPRFIWQSCIPGAAHPQPQYASCLAPLSAQVPPSSNPNETLPIMSTSSKTGDLPKLPSNSTLSQMRVSRCQMYWRKGLPHTLERRIWPKAEKNSSCRCAAFSGLSLAMLPGATPAGGVPLALCRG